ncbi:MAG: RIP metalloprotease RseP [Clostridia bacterium]
MDISNVVNFLIMMIKLVIALSIITVVHEFGHFSIAKLLKIKVNEFAIGFGPKIFSFKKRGTVYSLRWILLGGYNSLEGETNESEDPQAYSNQPGWKKLLVLFMGSINNLILAFVLFVIIAMSLNFPSTEIAKISKSASTGTSLVEEAGMKIGDKITKIDGKNVTIFSDITDKNIKNNEMRVTFVRDNKEFETTIKNAVKQISVIGIMLEADPTTMQNKIRFIEPGKQAMIVGLKAGDEITEVNGNKVKTLDEVIYQLHNNGTKPINMKVLRDEKEKSFEILKPEMINYFDIGFTPSILKAGITQKIGLSLKYAGDMFGRVLETYKDLFTGKAKVNQLSGIVGVGEIVSKTQDIWDFINLIAVVSLSIGIMNLLPIPPLDGGKIAITLGEMITRKKMSVNAEAMISYIFFGLLILLTIYVTWNDIIRIF